MLLCPLFPCLRAVYPAPRFCLTAAPTLTTSLFPRLCVGVSGVAIPRYSQSLAQELKTAKADVAAAHKQIAATVAALARADEMHALGPVDPTSGVAQGGLSSRGGVSGGGGYGGGGGITFGGGGSAGGVGMGVNLAALGMGMSADRFGVSADRDAAWLNSLLAANWGGWLATWLSNLVRVAFDSFSPLFRPSLTPFPWRGSRVSARRSACDCLTACLCLFLSCSPQLRGTVRDALKARTPRNKITPLAPYPSLPLPYPPQHAAETTHSARSNARLKPRVSAYPCPSCPEQKGKPMFLDSVDLVSLTLDERARLKPHLLFPVVFCSLFCLCLFFGWLCVSVFPAVWYRLVPRRF